MARPGKKADRLAAATTARHLVLGEDGAHSRKLPGVRASSHGRPDYTLSQPERAAPVLSPEEAFVASIPVAHRKRWGQYWTPQPIADLLVDWILAIRPATILDPAAGTGILVRSIRNRSPSGQITALDKDPLAVAAFREAAGRLPNVEIHCDDFLLWRPDACYDAIIANPPYLRHHDLYYDEDIFAIVGRRNGVRLTRLTNLYGMFLLEICRRLKPGGRASMIVPGEWLNANFGAPLKHFLLQHGLLKHLVYFSHAETIFPDALTTACLLFVEKPPANYFGNPGTRQSTRSPADWKHPATLHTLFAPSAGELQPIRQALGTVAEDRFESDLIPSPCAGSSSVNQQHLPHSVLLASPKWNALLEHGPGVIPDGFVPLGCLATTRRGIATGANPYFHVPFEQLKNWNLPSSTGRPCLGRAADVAGYIVSNDDFARLEQQGKRTRLLCFGSKLRAAERRYLEDGERQGLPRRYLLAARKPWYAMENRPPSAIWAAVFGRKELRFVWNRAGVLNLTTFHCVYPLQLGGSAVPALVACLNSRAVQQLARRQQRVYGGGLLKFEPRDLLQIPVPDLSRVLPNTLSRLETCLTELHGAERSLARRNVIHQRLDEAVGLAAEEAARTRSPS